MKNYKKNIYFFIGLISALWFAFIGMVWAYLIPLVLAYPFGILSYFLWRKLNKVEPERKRNKAIITILIIGVTLSLLSLIVMLIWDK